MAIEAVYEHPEDYDLELASRDVHDAPFWRELLPANSRVRYWRSDVVRVG